MGGSPRRRSRSAWSGRIVIAKPADPTAAAVNEMSAVRRRSHYLH
jgi:hypothetical protein